MLRDISVMQLDSSSFTGGLLKFHLITNHVLGYGCSRGMSVLGSFKCLWSLRPLAYSVGQLFLDVLFSAYGIRALRLGR